MVCTKSAARCFRVQERKVAGTKVEKVKKQKALKKWGKEDWQTKDEYEKGKKAAKCC